MAYTYTLINSGTVTSATQASIEFTSIPQTYTDLQILMSVRYSGSDTTGINVILNGDTSTSYNVRVLRGTGAGGAPQNNTSAQTFDFTALGAGGSTTGSSGSSQTASTFTNTAMYIPDYTGSKHKSISTDFVQTAFVTATFLGFYANLKASASAITSITISPSEGSWVQYSAIYLYGIKNS